MISCLGLTSRRYRGQSHELYGRSPRLLDIKQQNDLFWYRRPTRAGNMGEAAEALINSGGVLDNSTHHQKGVLGGMMRFALIAFPGNRTLD